MFWVVPEPKQVSSESPLRSGTKVHSGSELPANRSNFSSSETLLALSNVGVDFSVEGVKEWLDNDSTWYPAISTELLKLLREKRLAHQVHLDVIVYNYEQASGSIPPSSADAVDLGRLKAAVIKSYNTRYGVAVKDFDELLR